MGLDAYIVERKPGGGDVELCYFRKFYPLETMCTNIWAQLPKRNIDHKTADEFNCEYLYLDNKIIKKMDALCKDILNNKYFTPYSHRDDDYIKEAYQTYAKYLKEKIPELWDKLGSGADIAYISWW